MVLAAIVLAACAPAQAMSTRELPPTQTALSPSATAVQASPVPTVTHVQQTSTPRPSPTANAVPTTTPLPNGICPPISTSATKFTLPDPVPNLQGLRLDIEKYLDSGQDSKGLQPLTKNEQGKVIGSLLQLDLNGDKTDEVILSTSTSTEIEGYRWGWIGVYACDHGKFIANYAELGNYINHVTVLDGRDWLGRGTAQIVVEYNWWGSACEIGVQVLASSPQGWGWVFGDSLNCPAQAAIRENRGNGLPEIVLSGIEHDVMGVEPDKQVTRVYSVQAGQFQLKP